LVYGLNTLSIKWINILSRQIRWETNPLGKKYAERISFPQFTPILSEDN